MSESLTFSLGLAHSGPHCDPVLEAALGTRDPHVSFLFCLAHRITLSTS